MVSCLRKITENQDAKYFLDSGKYKFLKSFFTLLGNLFLAWFLANQLSKETYGQYIFAFSVISVFSIFSLPGIKEAISQSVARGFENSLKIGTKLALKHSIWGSMGLILVSVYYFFFKDDQFALVFFISAFLFPFFFTLDNFFSYFDGRQLYKKDFIYRITIELFKTISIVLCVSFFTKNIAVIIGTLLLSQILFYFLFYFKTKRTIKHSDNADEGLEKYGKFLTKIYTFTIIMNYFDKLIIGLLLGPISLALYQVGIMLPSKTKPLIKPILYVFFPKFSNGQMKLTKSKLKFFGLISFALVVLYITIIPFFISILFPNYKDATQYGIMFSLIMLALPLNVIFEYYYKAKKRLGIIKKTLVIPKIVSLLISIPAIFLWGIYGIIYSLIFEQIFTLSINLFFYANMHKIKSRDV